MHTVTIRNVRTFNLDTIYESSGPDKDKLLKDAIEFVSKQSIIGYSELKVSNTPRTFTNSKEKIYNVHECMYGTLQYPFRSMRLCYNIAIDNEKDRARILDNLKM